MENVNPSKIIHRTENEILELIFSYAEKLNSERDINKLLHILSSMGKDLAEADRCTVWLWDKSRFQLYSMLADGENELRIPDSSGLVGYAVQNATEIISNDPYSDPRFNRQVDKDTGYVTRGILVVPMYGSDGGIIGAYQILNKMTETMTFDKRDLERLRLTASFAAKAIEASLMYNEVEKTQREVIQILGEVGESRSQETGNHVKRVAAYCAIIGRALGLPDEEIDLLRMASPLHDLGKVSIPDAILEKPGKLTDEEYERMKTHSAIGYEILAKSPRKVLKTASIIAHQHHERYDGKGYPQRLIGNQSHIYARITAIADVFDALISDRVYKKAWELDRVLALFKDERGRQFDPDVIDAFFNSLDKLLEAKEKYKDCI